MDTHMTNQELLDILRTRLEERDDVHLQMHRELVDISIKLKASEQLKSNFLSNVRNEINNPLSSILGLSRILASATEQTFEQFKSKATMLYQEAFQLDFKIRNIIAAAEIEAGETRPNPVKMNVRDVVETTLRSFDFKREQKQLNVRTNFDLQGDDYFITDPYMFFIVILNLVANGIEFSDPEKDLVITVRKKSDLRVEIQDYGGGIRPEDHGRIFERFRQLDEGSTKRHHGQGLGLSVAREFAEALGGTLELTTSDHNGSIFLFVIPSPESLDIRHTATGGWNEVLFGNSEIL
jgi:signal transduction histidine kinase